MKQLIESQTDFQRQVRETITTWQKNHTATTQDLKTQLQEAYTLIQHNNQNHQHQINQHHQYHQSQLKQLASMNEVFSKNLNGVLTHMTDKMVAHVKADTQTALEANTATIIVNLTEASKGVTDMVEDFNKNLTTIYKKSKTILDSRVKGYHTSMANLFKLDGWRQVFFWLGMYGSIATPILLIILLVMNWL